MAAKMERDLLRIVDQLIDCCVRVPLAPGLGKTLAGTALIPLHDGEIVFPRALEGQLSAIMGAPGPPWI